MNLPRERDRPRRREHPVTPPWQWEDDDTMAPPGEIYDADPERLTPEYRRLVDEVQVRSGGRCEVQLQGCHGPGVDPHHVYPTSEGGPVVVPVSWLLWVCRSCHGRIHSAKYRPLAEALQAIVPLRRKRAH